MNRFTRRTRTHMIGAPGTLLGIVDDPNFSADTTRLDPGDVVVFYTDGATDVRPPHNLDAAQFARLVASATATRGTAETIADDIHRALEAILPLDARNDDVALLILRAT